MSVSKKDVEKIAQLAKLKFNDQELDSFTDDMNRILSYVDKLNELDTESVEPLSHPNEGSNVFRDDELKKSISTDEALKISPDRNDKFFKVPKVIQDKS